MKLKLKQLVEAAIVLPGSPPDTVAPIKELSQNKLIPAKPAYWIAKICRRLESEVEDYSKSRAELLDKHGTTSDEKRTYSFTTEQAIAFNAEHTALLEIEIDLTGLNQISLDSLGDALIAPEVMAALDWMVVE